MTNVNRSFGFTPVGYLNAADWDGRGNLYYIDSADTNAFYIGDLVKLSGSGDATRGLPGITLATAGAAAVGVILAVGIVPDGGPYINPGDLSAISAPATKAQNYYALVGDDPNIIYEIQEGGASAALAATNIGENIDVIFTAPIAGQRLSSQAINNGAHDTTSTRNCKLLGLVRRVDIGGMNTFGAFSKWKVIINNHNYRVGTTGV